MAWEGGRRSGASIDLNKMCFRKEGFGASMYVENDGRKVVHVEDEIVGK